MCRVNRYPNTYFTNSPNGAYTYIFNKYSLDLVGLTNPNTQAANMKGHADPNQTIPQAN